MALAGFGRRAWLGAAAVAFTGTGLAGCDEMRRPPGQSPLPAELTPPGPDPVRGAITATAAAFANQGQRLAGQPEATARAVAQFEYLYDAIGREARWGALVPSVRISLRIARDEIRQVIGIRPEATGPQVVQAMAQVVRSLRVRDRNGAGGALSGAIFAPGGQATLFRLNRPAPMPAAEQATAQLAAEVARLDAQGGWAGSVASPEAGFGTTLSPALGGGGGSY